MLKFNRLTIKATSKKNDKGPLVGIDVSSQHAFLLELQPNKQRFTLKSFVNQRLEDNTFNNDALSNAEAFTQTIDQLREKASIEVGNSVIAAPAHSAVNKLFELDQTLPSSQQEALALREAKAAFPESSSDLLVDYSPLPSEQTDKVLLVAGRKSQIMKRVDAISAAKLTPIVVDVDYLALQRALLLIEADIPSHWQEHPIAMVHINSCYILFIIVHKEQLLFQHHEHYQGQHLDEIVDSIILHSELSLNDEERHQAIAQAARQVKRQWQYYQAQQPHQKLNGIVLSGTLACLPESKQILADNLGAEVILADPLGKMAVDASIDLAKVQLLSPATLLACGLAMRKKRMLVRINLLPWRDKIRAKKRQDFYTLLLASALAAGLLSGALFWSANSSLNKQSNEIAYLQQQAATLTNESQALENIEKPANKAEEQLNYFKQLLQSRYIIVELFNTITAAIPNGVSLSSLQRDKNEFIVKGLAKNSTDINLILTRLNSSNILQQAKLKEIKIQSNQENIFTIVADIVIDPNKDTKNETSKQKNKS